MTDVADLRRMVGDAWTDAREGDALAALSAGGLLTVFNRLAPHGFRLSTASEVSLTVAGSRTSLTGRDVAMVVDRFSRAVASIGQELTLGSAAFRQLRPADYDRAPVFLSGTPGGPLVLSAGPSSPILGTIPGGPSVAERALTRLANLLPASGHDPTLASRVLSSRPPTARAMNEIALVAKKLDGIVVSLRGTNEDTTATVATEQATAITELLADVREDVTTQHLTGQLDGMRFRRREFFLTVGERDISGSVDEFLVPTVRALLDQQVVATLERVVRRSSAGSAQRPAYRLVDVRPLGQLEL